MRLLVALCALLSLASAEVRQKCMSGIKGDYAYKACGEFCKEEKKQNHCKFCKCQKCAFCADVVAAAPAAPIGKKQRKAGAKAAAAPAAAAADADGKKACASSFPGDFKYETCAGFCKKANHCKYCKCKTCGFCTGGGDAPAAAAACASAT